MVAHHLNMVRSQCRVEASFGGRVPASLATIRFSPQAGKDEFLRTTMARIEGSGIRTKPHSLMISVTLMALARYLALTHHWIFELLAVQPWTIRHRLVIFGSRN
jgi:hypothetical protein